MRIIRKKSNANMVKSPSGNFAVRRRSDFGFCAGAFLSLSLLVMSAAQAQTTTYVLGTSALLVGPAAGSNSDLLAVTPKDGTWTATTNAMWLHLTVANQSGTGSTNVVFSYDANPGQTRSSTLNIGDQTLAVTQAGSNYIAAQPLTTLVSSGLSDPFGVAVDGSGNVYIADYGDNAIKEWTAASNVLTTLLSSGLSTPVGVAVDGAGNVYIADTGNNAIKEWTAADSIVTLLAHAGLSGPLGVAVDGPGNVYIADTGNDAIKKWTKARNTVTTLVSLGAGQPNGVALDIAGNVYIAVFNDNILEKWTLADNTLTALVSGLVGVDGVAVDGAGNVFTADFNDLTVKEWTAANGNVTVLASSGLNYPGGVAVDDADNVYIADSYDGAIKEIPCAFVDPTGRLESLAAGVDSLPVVLPSTVNLLPPFAPSTDEPWLTITGITNGVVSYFFAASSSNRTGNITLLGQTIPITQGGPTFSLSTNALLERQSAGSDSVFLTVTPNSATWTATANASWLHLSLTNQSGTGSATVVFNFDANLGDVRTSTLSIAGYTLTVSQASAYTLSTFALVEGPAAGSDSVVLAAALNANAWTASANAAWLYLSPANQSGTGSTNVLFNYDANPGPTRSGTLTIAGETVTVTQAGSTYVSVEFLTTLSSFGSGPDSVAVDGAGNLYVGADYVGAFPYEFPYYAIYERTATNGAISTLLSAGSGSIDSLAADGAGNIYFLTGGPNLGEWMASNDAVTGLVSSASGLGGPCGVAADAAGDVYIADSAYDSVQVVFAGSTNLVPLITTELNSPEGVALDGAGNVYIADTGDNAVKEWSPANNTLIDLVSSNLNAPQSVAVDGSGNVYISDTGDNAIKEWMPASYAVITLLSGLNNPVGVAVDVSGNVYEVEGMFVESYPNQFSGDIKELFRVFVDPSLRLESLAAGSDSLPPVLPPTQNLVGPFAPVSRDPWLTITGVTNGVVSFSFATASSNRTGYIEILGQAIPVAQGAESFNYALGTTALVEGPEAGTDSVVLGANPFFTPWTATANAPWLHLSPANQSGPGSTNVVFSFDVNPGVTRTGTLTIAGQTLAVTQAGATYVAAGQLTTLVASNQNTPLSGPNGVAVDGAGDVYIADTGDQAIKEWSPTSQTLVTLVGSNSTVPLNILNGIAVDGAGNLYVTDWGNNKILKWSASDSNVTTLVSSNLNHPAGVAVDVMGNVYFTDFGNSVIKEWMAGYNIVTTLVGEVGSFGVAVDTAGNVYWVDYGYSAAREWIASTATGITLVSSGLFYPVGATVDGSGNLYIANTSIFKWSAITGEMTPIVPSGIGSPLYFPNATAVDSAGNLYIADTANCAIKELPHAFVDVAPRFEGAGAGSDFLAVVLPATENLLGPFTPTSDQPWLTITGVTNGVISCSFTDTSSIRKAVITVLGQSIPIIQTTTTYLFVTNAILAGAAAGSASVILEVFPNTTTWTATANVPWLHLSLASQNGTGSANLAFSYDANPGAMRSGTISVGGQTLTVTQTASVVSLGANALLEGPAAGGDSVILIVSPSNAPWAAAPNAVWLHLSPANQNGAGSTNLVFNFDSNPSATRTGTISIVGQTLTIIQAGSTYVQAGIVTPLVASGLDAPRGVAGTGHAYVYFADTFNNAIKMWTASDNSVTTLLASGLNNPCGIATDGTGNVYIADTGNNAIKLCTAANSNVTTLVSSGLSAPQGVAVDGLGNVYIADTGNGAIKEWMAANGTVTALVSSGLSYPAGVAVDAAGNVYIADSGHNAIKKWLASNSNLTSLVASGLSSPGAVAVDGSGNVYVADTGNGAIKKWTAANNTVNLLISSGLSYPYGVGVDSAGNLYIADTDNQAIKELPRSFVDPTPKLEGLAAGTDVLPMVLPATTDLLPPFAPTTGQPWLTIGGIANGVVDFDFAGTSTNRTANITMLGQIIPVSQSAIGTPPTLIRVQMLAEGVLQFDLTNNPSASFTVLSATNLSLPLSNWAVVGTATNIGSGVFQFTSPPTINDPQRYYGVRSP
jgi:DNA-binding beta-propeller fold protein YncE